MFGKLGLVILLVSAAPAIASAQEIPTGILLVDGLITNIGSPACYSNFANEVTGYISNPGPGKVGTEIELHLSDDQSVGVGLGVILIVKGFPAQPLTGLNGWTAASPASATQYQYVSGSLVQTNKAPVSFSLIPISTRTSQGVVTIGYPGTCLETIQLNATREGR